MDTLTRLAGIERFAERVENETRQRFIADGFTPEIHERQAIKVTVKPGKKYTKVDVGTSGRFMVTADGEIYGIKAYGVIHLGHHYGTLDTIDAWYWGDYSPRRVANGQAV